MVVLPARLSHRVHAVWGPVLLAAASLAPQAQAAAGAFLYAGYPSRPLPMLMGAGDAWHWRLPRPRHPRLPVGGMRMGGTKFGTRGPSGPDGQSSGTRTLTLTPTGDTPQRLSRSWEIRVVRPDEIVINFNATLGEGTYGYVFMAEFTAGQHTGKKAVVKCAISGDDEHSGKCVCVCMSVCVHVHIHTHSRTWTHINIVMAAAYLATESYMNDAIPDDDNEVCMFILMR